MSTIYSRLGYNFDTTKFGNDVNLAAGANNFLNNSSVNLSQWQVDDIASSSASGYYQNPHATVLSNLTVVLTGMAANCNTSSITFDNAPAEANTLYSSITNTLNAISNFTTHTNCISGVERSANTVLYPELNSALSVGRQVLSLTNKADQTQNNVPILGNFTSLYIKDDISAKSNTLINDSIILSNSLYDDGGNTFSNISVSSINSITVDVNSLQTLLNTRRNADIAFYQNSLAIIHDYQTVLTFSNVGDTQNSLLQIVGTEKLKNDLATAQPLPVTANVSSALFNNPYASALTTGTGTGTTIITGGSGGSSTSGGSGTYVLTETGVGPGTYGSANRIPVFTVDRYGRITSATSLEAAGGGVSIIEFNTSSTASIAVDTFDINLYRSAKYEIQITSGSYYQVIELRIMHNGLCAFMTQYGEIVSDITLGQFDADVGNGFVNLYFRPTQAINTVKMIRRLITI
jgi:hypothetical protein